MITEENRPGFKNIKPTFLYHIGERPSFFLFIFHVTDGYITRLEGIKVVKNGVRWETVGGVVVCEPKEMREILDFFIKNGDLSEKGNRTNTCFMPNYSNYKDFLLKPLPKYTLVNLTLKPRIEYYADDNLYSKDSYLLIQRGQSYARVYSFADYFPKPVGGLPKVDTKAPTPLSLEEFVDLFILVLNAATLQGIRFDAAYSAASIGSTYFSDTLSVMFKNLNKKVPYKVLFRAYQCFKAHRFEARVHGIFSILYYYDLKDAFPTILSKLVPCFEPYVKWIDDPNYHPNAFYGFIRAALSTDPNLLFQPVMFRLQSYLGPRLFALKGKMNVWLEKSEFDSLVWNGFGKVLEIQGASWGYVEIDLTPMKDVIEDLLSKQDDPIIGPICKGVKHVITGKMASAREDPILYANSEGDERIISRTRLPAISGLPYACKVWGEVRAIVGLLANKYNAVAILADGFYTTEPIPEGELPPGVRLKAVGKGGVWTDMYTDAPGTTRYLDVIMASDPNKPYFLVDIDEVLTISGAQAVYGGKYWEKHIGDRIINPARRYAGTKKRLILRGDNLPLQEYLDDNPESEPLEATLDNLDYLVAKINPWEPA